MNNAKIVLDENLNLTYQMTVGEGDLLKQFMRNFVDNKIFFEGKVKKYHVEEDKLIIEQIELDAINIQLIRPDNFVEGKLLGLK